MAEQARAQSHGEPEGGAVHLAGWDEKFNHLKPKVIPVVVFPDGSAINDSTFIIRRIETELGVGPDRPALPRDPGLRFIASLLEDFADEWLTKCMYGFRWNTERGARFGSTLLAADMSPGVHMDKIRTLAGMFSEMQTSRTAVVGCADATINYTFHAVCEVLEAHFQVHPFLLGPTPSAPDFSFYGQMSQWLVDRVPAEILPESYPLVYTYILRMEDLSGMPVPGGAAAADDLTYSPTLARLLAVVGESYLPFLVANERAVLKGAGAVSLTIGGRQQVVHEQRPFGYQVKCLQWLREELHDVGAGSRAHAWLEEAGCGAHLLPASANGGQSKL